MEYPTTDEVSYIMKSEATALRKHQVITYAILQRLIDHAQKTPDDRTGLFSIAMDAHKELVEQMVDGIAPRLNQ